MARYGVLAVLGIFVACGDEIVNGLPAPPVDAVAVTPALDTVVAGGQVTPGSRASHVRS